MAKDTDRGPGQIVTSSISFPSRRQMAKNVINAAVDAAASGFETVSQEEKSARLTICSGCPDLHHKRCALCGCWVEFKSTLKEWHCPADKW